ncbi:hypothetical protein [Pseudomonas putida]|uniref:Uncharacterized protein n=2 Tax=Pseudomonas putida TaxID=303 RepID=A0AAW4BUG3_PSEPU|nr:hypothetical protein [Pseudomonas putida]MBF8703050.1 hypothetical protein [Pseudomonas putida]MBF8736906.1 hypothetical protein [Pseudomonas putida]
MSTFAVFGMTRDVALAEAKKRVKTSKPGKAGGPSIQLTPAQWDEAVAKYADKLMSGEKVKQLSNLFDAPQYAQQFIELARKQGDCRDLRIRARCALTDAKGNPVINPKTKMPRIGWSDYGADGKAKAA